MTTEKICFRYDGSPEAKQAHKLWDNIKSPQTNIPEFDCFYYSSGVAYNWDESKPSGYRLVTPAEFLRLVKGEEVKYPSALGSIDVSQKDGKRLMAALAIITTECRRDKTPDECIKEIDDLAYEMYKPKPKPKPKSLREEIAELPESLSKENVLAIIDRHEKERGVEG